MDVEVKTETVETVETTNETTETTEQDATSETTNVDANELATKDAEIERLTALAQEQAAQLAQFEATKSSMEKQSNLLSEYEAIITSVIEDKLSGVSDEVKSLIPSGTAKERYDWVLKAESANLFKTEPKQDIEIGKPMNVTGTDKKVDTTKLSATQLMQMAYASLKK